MVVFCPSCGRTHRYNQDSLGLTPKLCPTCLFFLDKTIDPGRRSGAGSGRNLNLKALGLTHVLN
jgi:hypothetical protein